MRVSLKTDFYVKTDMCIYRVKDFESYDNIDYIQLHLEMVCGWCDELETFVEAKRFEEDLQDMYENCYILSESVKECLEDNGYEIIKECPDFISK